MRSRARRSLSAVSRGTAVRLSTSFERSEASECEALSVYPTHDWIDRRDDRHRVGHQPTPQHHRQGLQIDEGWIADPHAVGLGAAIAHQVATELAARLLD